MNFGKAFYHRGFMIARWMNLKSDSANFESVAIGQNSFCGL